MIVCNPIIMILKAILNRFRLRRDYIANAVDKIPPEIKDALVAWYSPCKQKLTNYDVIESYNEDFNSNNWKHTNNVTVTNNSFHLTYGNLTYELYPINNYNIKPMTIIVKGMAGIIGFIRYRYGINENYIDINKDGVYYLPAKVDDTNVLGFQTHFKSECDITITQLPTSILKDFSGNKHDAYLYAFKGKLNSGVSIYTNDFTDSGVTNATWVYEKSKVTVNGHNSFTIIKATNDWIFRCTKNVSAMKIQIVGMNNEVDFRYRYESSNGDKWIYLNQDGVYELPATIGTWQGFWIKNPNNVNVNIIVTQIPDYSDQLCYDGKSYAITYELPILTDYTVIADRTWFAEKVNNGVFMSKALEQNGAFILEYKQGDRWNTYSYYSATNINIDKDNSIVYQTKNKYNEQTIYPGDKQDTDTLFIGTIRKDDSRSFIGCHGDIFLFNRTLTDDELDLVKEHFFGIVRIKDALLTVDGKPIITTDNKYIKVNKK